LTLTPGDTQIILNWTAPADDGGSSITDYNVYRSQISGSYGAALTNVGSASLSYVDSAVTNGITYYYKVAAINSIGEGSKSTETSATPSGVPQAPTGLSATPSNQQVGLSWNEPNDGGSTITEYKIYRNGSYIDNVTYPTTTYSDTGLTNGWNYVYEVSAVNVNGEGANSTAVGATPSTTPSTPTGLNAIPGDTNVSLSWVAPSDGGSPITGYNIYRNGSLYAPLGVVTSYNDTGLTNGWNYVYEVAAVNDNGEGPKSSSANATPSTKPGTPTGLTAIPGNANISLSWVAPSDGGSPITGYNIYRNGSLYDSVVGPGTSYNDTGLTNGWNYVYCKCNSINKTRDANRIDCHTRKY
jgi:hypothetical protein